MGWWRRPAEFVYKPMRGFIIESFYYNPAILKLSFYNMKHVSEVEYIEIVVGIGENASGKTFKLFLYFER